MRLRAGLIVFFLCCMAIPALAQEDERELLVSAGRYLADVETFYNVCVEEILRPGYGLMPQDPVSYDMEFRLPADTLPCVNEAGQRLNYYNDSRQRRDAPVYSRMPVIIYTPDAATPTCVADLARANPLTDAWGFFRHMRLFVPPDAHDCQLYTPDSETLYDLSRRFNVCMEAIQAANLYPDQTLRLSAWREFQGSPINIPTDLPPCYAKNGQRINHTDRALYTPVSGQSLYDVARQQAVCMDDLLDANPFLDASTHLPEVLFIPASPPCDDTGSLIHVMRPGQTINMLALLYNVCINRIYEANPSLQWVEPAASLTTGMQIAIPARPACLTLAWGSPYDMIKYVCYPEAVDPGKDYTGHTPPVSPIVGTDSDFCHERRNTTLVIYQNAPLLVYQLRRYDTPVTVGQCFGVDPYKLIEANASTYPLEVRPVRYWVIPAPYDPDCYLLTADNATYYAREKEASYKAGYLDENGVYTVNYQDTLSSIGREFGYLPSMIAAANNLPDPSMIYFRQQLKMPPYPSLYVLGKVALIGAVPVALVVAGFGLVRWRRRSTRKRKNDSAA